MTGPPSNNPTADSALETDTPTRPILYSFRRCPYAMRARMALYASGIAVELREIVLKNKPAPMLAASPKGSVPVLVLPNGDVIDESLDIMVWALDRADPLGWLGKTDAHRTRDHHLVAQIDGPFKHHLDRYKYAARYTGEGADPVAHRTQALAILDAVTDDLSTQPFLSGEKDGLADRAIWPFVRQFRIADPAWFDALDRPHLLAWLNHFLNDPLFKAMMKKYPPWQDGDTPTVMFGHDHNQASAAS